jgi:N-acetylglutamate synthase-like GNAT family acetyltransferase
VNIVGPQLNRMVECEAVLRTLPRWFGIEHALLMYVQDTAKLPTFAIEQDDRVVGFLTLREHFPTAWEVHCMAIEAQARGKYLGSELLAHSEAWLRKRGVEFLQVKTVAATSKSPEYAQTRKFYEARGFVPVEIFPELWDPRNPALQCIKRLSAA